MSHIQRKTTHTILLMFKILTEFIIYALSIFCNNSFADQTLVLQQSTVLFLKLSSWMILCNWGILLKWYSTLRDYMLVPEQNIAAKDCWTPQPYSGGSRPVFEVSGNWSQILKQRFFRGKVLETDICSVLCLAYDRFSVQILMHFLLFWGYFSVGYTILSYYDSSNKGVF